MCPGRLTRTRAHAVKAGKLYLISINCQGAKLCGACPKAAAGQGFRPIALRRALCGAGLAAALDFHWQPTRACAIVHPEMSSAIADPSGAA